MTNAAFLPVPIRRAALGLVAVGSLVAAMLVFSPWAPALWLVPDVALLAGLSKDMARDGRLAPRAVPLYNALHALPGPLALIAAGAVTTPAVLGLGLIWLSHVAGDRALGYGLRDRDGFQRA